MKYYIPTSSLNFNNILSTESISPKAMYEKRGYGYSRWFTVEENNIEHTTLLFDTLCVFDRPISDIEDHAMLIEIISDDDFPKLPNGVYYTDKTIYLNPWQTRFIFFSDKVKRTVMSMSDSSLETKFVRLYQRKMVVLSDIKDRGYKIIKEGSIPLSNNMESNIEEDYIINKMKGLLYGYYIGANLSSSKEHILKLDSLREINNIFASIISGYDRIPSVTQKKRLDELFTYIDSQQPIFKDLEKELGSVQLASKALNVFKRYGSTFGTVDRIMLLEALKKDTENNQALNWVNHEIAKANALFNTSKSLLNPDDGELIVSGKEKLISQKCICEDLMANLFIHWINIVLCSHSFNGKINSIKETLSDEITKDAKNVIRKDWDNSPIRAYLNQLRRHVRGEEFNQPWDNGVLSSIAAVLIKGDDWEQLLHFMQSKGMYDYRLAFAFYGVLNGLANMTRDFTDNLLNKDSGYLSMVYRDFYGQLFDKSIPEIGYISTMPEKNDNTGMLSSTFESSVNKGNNPIVDWRRDIKLYAETVIKRDKMKLFKSLDEALAQNGDNQDYFRFIKMLDNFDGWKPGKNRPCSAWKRMQEHFVPDYNERIGKSAKTENIGELAKQQETSLFDGIEDDTLHYNNTIKQEKSFNPSNKTSNLFVDDENVTYFIGSQTYLPTDVRATLCKKVLSFQKDYAPNGYYFGKKDSPRTNDNTIKHFINKCTYQKEHSSSPSWISATSENKVLLDKLKNALYQRYANG